MKLKNLIFLIISGVLLFNAASAQDVLPFSLKIYGGYTAFTPGSEPVPLTPQVTFGPSVNVSASGTLSRSSMGAGAGFHFGAGIEKDFLNVFMGELDVDYLSGSKLTGNVTTTSPQNTFVNGNGTASILSITPSLGIKVLKQSNYTLYTRAGMILAVDTKYQTMQVDGPNSYSKINGGTSEYTYHYGLTAGLQGAFGVNFKLKGNVRAFVELTDNLLAPKPNTSLQNVVANNTDGTVLVTNTTLTYIKGSSGNRSFSLSPTYTNTSGNTTTTDYSWENTQIQQHMNSVVLNAGIFVDFK